MWTFSVLSPIENLETKKEITPSFITDKNVFKKAKTFCIHSDVCAASHISTFLKCKMFLNLG